MTKSFSLPEKQDVLKAFLSEDALLMDEAVVVGYGTQKKVNLTGAISTVEASELANRATSTLGHML